MIAAGPGTFGSLWVDGEEIVPAELDRLAATIHRELHGLPAASVVQLPTDPVVSIVARAVVAQLGLAYALGDVALGCAGMDAAALIDADGTVHKAAASRLPQRLPGAARISATSGSTGHPEAVAHGHDAIAFQAGALQERLRFGADEVMLLPMPTTHAYGAAVVELWSRYGVGLMLEHTSPIRAVVPRLIEHTVSSVDLVPSTLAMLLSAARRDAAVADAIDRLRLLNVGGDVLPPSLVRMAQEVCDQPVLDGYGLTEAGPNVAVNSPEVYRVGTVGQPLRGVQVRIDDDEVLVRSQGVMLGYVRAGAVVSQSDSDGWLATGDTGVLDDQGFLRIIGRRKEIIIVHGKTFAPVAIEDALRTVPGVDNAGVVAVRGSGSTRDHVHAFVRPEDRDVDPDRLVRFCASAMPDGLGPVRFRLIDEVPLLVSGKVDRCALREAVRSCT